MNVTWDRPGTEEDTKNLKKCLECCDFEVAVLPPASCTEKVFISSGLSFCKYT